MDDLIHATEAIEDIQKLCLTDPISINDHVFNRILDKACDVIKHCHPVYPEMTYVGLSNALLYLWMENIITDSQYNNIMDRLNEAHKNGTI